MKIKKNLVLDDVDLIKLDIVYNQGCENLSIYV